MAATSKSLRSDEPLRPVNHASLGCSLRAATQCPQPRATGDNRRDDNASPPTFDVSFTKYVDIFDRVQVNKDINVDVWVKGNSAIGNATADAMGKNTHTETLTQTYTSEGHGSSSVSESLSASTKDFQMHWNHN